MFEQAFKKIDDVLWKEAGRGQAAKCLIDPDRELL